MCSLVRNMCSLYSSTDFNIQMMQCSVLFSDSGTVINPRRACAARVTVVVLCVSVSRPRIRYSRNYKTK